MTAGHPTPPAETTTPLSEAVFCAFDTETTGLSPLDARPLELAGVRFRGDGAVLDRFTALCDPGCPIPGPIARMTGIGEELVRGRPDPAAIVASFLQFVDPTDILCAHNAAFDVSFVGEILRRANRPMPPNPVLDSLRVAELLGVPKGSRSLRNLSERLGLPAGRFHRALPDAERVRAIVVRAIAYLEGEAAALGDGIPTDPERTPTPAVPPPSAPPTVELVLKLAGAFAFGDVEVAAIPAPEGLEPIEEALAAGASVDLDYGRPGTPPERHRVRPISLYRTGDRRYLVAWCAQSGLDRSYRLDRIQQVALRR